MRDDVYASVFLLLPLISLTFVLSASFLKSFHWGGCIGPRHNRKRHHAHDIAGFQCALCEIPKGGRDHDMRTQSSQHLFRFLRIATDAEPAILVILTTQITKDRGWEVIAALHLKTRATSRKRHHAHDIAGFQCDIMSV